jgi:hypothetical protein
MDGRRNRALRVIIKRVNYQAMDWEIAEETYEIILRDGKLERYFQIAKTKEQEAEMKTEQEEPIEER